MGCAAVVTVEGLLGDPKMGERHGTFGYNTGWPDVAPTAPPAAPEKLKVSKMAVKV